MDLKRLSNSGWLYRAVLATWIAGAIIVMFLLSKIDSIINVEMYKHGLQFSSDWANPYWTYLNLNYVALGVPVALSLFVIALGFVQRSRMVFGRIAGRLPRSRLEMFTSWIKKVGGSVAGRLVRSRPRGFISGIRKVFGRISARLAKSRPKELVPRIGRVSEKVAGRLARSRSKESTPKIKKVVEKVAAPQPVLPVPQPVASQEQRRPESSWTTSTTSDVAEKLGPAHTSCPSCGKTFGRPMVMLDFEGGKSRLVNVCPYCGHVLGFAENGESSGVDVQVADLDEELKH